jgi:hypothetical protein
MNDNHTLLDRINQSFKANAGKAIFSTGLLIVSQMGIVVFMVMMVQVFPTFFALPLAILSGTALIIVQYGFMILLYKLYTGKRAIIGDLFSGFTDIRRIGNAALRFLAIDCAAVVVCALIVALLSTMVPGILTNFSRLFLVVFALYGATIVTVLIRFAFVWFVLFENPKLKAREAFTKSALHLMAGKQRLLALALRAGGGYLFCAIAFYVLNFVLFPIPLPDLSAFGIQAAAPNNFTAPDGISMLLNIGYYITFALSLIKMVLALAAFYTELTSSDASLELPPQSIESTTGC